VNFSDLQLRGEAPDLVAVHLVAPESQGQERDIVIVDSCDCVRIKPGAAMVLRAFGRETCSGENKRMDEPDSLHLINDFLGSAHVFAAAVADVIEEQLLKEVTESTVTASQLKLLKLVSFTGTQSIGAVAAFLGISGAAASKTVDKLVRMMLLRRSEAETDRRAIHLSLTQPSRRLLANYDAARQRKLREIFGDCNPQDLKQAAELLDRLSACMIGVSANPEEMCLQCGIYFREKCILAKLLNRRCLYQRQTGNE
jgi:DNA-binding MarR family transcriptional regulator